MKTAAGTPLLGSPVAIALLAGASACLLLPAAAPVLLAALSLAVGATLWWRSPRLRLAGALAFGFGVAGLHVTHALAVRLPAEPVWHRAEVSGRIVDLPRTEPRRTVFLFRIERSRDSRLEGRLVRLSWYAGRGGVKPVARVGAGERWRFDVRLRAPRGLRNAGGSDTEKHALVDRLGGTGTVRPETAQRLSAPAGIAGWREAASARVDAAVGKPEARFIRALALGDTRFLDDADWTVLRANGLTHLIAISGFHVGMVAGFCALLLRAMWWMFPVLARRVPARIAASIAGFAGAAVYAAAAGFALPTVRTLLMVGVVALAQSARRRAGVAQSLAFAAIAILVVDPLSVLTAGFWLSFLGVAWLVWCLPRERGSAVAGLAKAQAVASVGLLPVTIVLFDQASLAGPLANLVAVPLWSLVVAPLAVAGLALEWLHPSLAGAAWRAAAWCFDLAWPSFESLGSSPVSLWWLPESHWVAFPLALLGAFWLLLPAGVPGKGLALLLWLPLLWPDVRRPDPGEAVVTVLDVGQGLSVLVRTRSRTLLYDMGPAVPEGYDAGERAVVPALRAHGVRRIDQLVLSHADLDHRGGLDAVRAAFPDAALAAPESAGIDGARACLPGEDWEWDGVRFSILHPPRYFPDLRNEASCVLRVEAAGRVALLTGDIGAIIERRLVAEQPDSIRADVVVVAHHGSRHSSDPAFVAATRARHAVVSAGHGNRFRHPGVDVVKRWTAADAMVWDTGRHGALTFGLGRDGVHASARRMEKPRLWDAARQPAVGNAGLSYRRD